MRRATRSSRPLAARECHVVEPFMAPRRSLVNRVAGVDPTDRCSIVEDRFRLYGQAMTRLQVFAASASMNLRVKPR